MLKTGYIKNIAQKKLEESELIELFSRTPLGQPFLSDVRSCEYYSNGYEVPIQVKYEDQDISIGSCMISKDGKKYKIPDKEIVLRLLKHGIKFIHKKKKEEELDRAVASYHNFREETDIALDLLDYQSYERFKDDVEKGKAPSQVVESFVDFMTHSIPNLHLKLITALDPASIKLDVFPYVRINYALEGKISNKRLDEAVDMLISLSNYHDETFDIVEERERREKENDYPVFYDPLLIRVRDERAEDIFVVDRLVASDKDLQMKQKSIDEAVENNFKILRSLQLHN